MVLKVNDYIVSMALTYFKERGKDYIISELMEILGYSRYQIDDLIMSLIQAEHLHYEDNLLTITAKGITHLISKNHAGFQIQVDDLPTPHINIQKAQSIDVPYVPIHFAKKYKG